MYFLRSQSDTNLNYSFNEELNNVLLNISTHLNLKLLSPRNQSVAVLNSLSSPSIVLKPILVLVALVQWKRKWTKLKITWKIVHFPKRKQSVVSRLAFILQHDMIGVLQVWFKIKVAVTIAVLFAAATALCSVNLFGRYKDLK